MNFGRKALKKSQVARLSSPVTKKDCEKNWDHTLLAEHSRLVASPMGIPNLLRLVLENLVRNL